MALLQCSECSGKVSDKATGCPHCGAPVIADTDHTPPPETSGDNRDDRETAEPAAPSKAASVAQPIPAVTDETNHVITASERELDVRPFMSGLMSLVMAMVFAALAFGTTNDGGIGVDTVTCAIVACLLLPPTRWLIEKIITTDLTRTHLVVASTAGIVVFMGLNGERAGTTDSNTQAEMTADSDTEQTKTGSNTAEAQQERAAENIASIGTSVAHAWSQAISDHDVERYRRLLAPWVRYYKDNKAAKDVAAAKARALAQSPGYAQSITGDVMVTKVENDRLKLAFTKTYTVNNVSKSAGTVLEIERATDGRWLVVVESDSVTERNREIRAAKQQTRTAKQAAKREVERNAARIVSSEVERCKAACRGSIIKNFSSGLARCQTHCVVSNGDCKNHWKKEEKYGGCINYAADPEGLGCEHCW